MTLFDYITVSLVAVICGLDRMAVCQVMISRPIVAGPLTGFVLGAPLIGLEVGLLVELLWLGRLPVGASIPPDDTQIATGATFLAISAAGIWNYPQPVTIAICLLVAIPLGKSGQLFDHMTRRANDNLGKKVDRFLQAGELGTVERSHLVGLGHFAISSLSTFLVVAGIGSLICYAIFPLLARYLVPAGEWLLLVFPLIGAAMILRSININRSVTLFSASFTSSLLILWLL
ncbi:MAG: hypothetical protein C0623_01145 [Desulfuromonas sp.]|nr:MAG: hypothetical protein C0623_01145 [Desulfuromonas sp.]